MIDAEVRGVERELHHILRVQSAVEQHRIWLISSTCLIMVCKILSDMP